MKPVEVPNGATVGWTDEHDINGGGVGYIDAAGDFVKIRAPWPVLEATVLATFPHEIVWRRTYQTLERIGPWDGSEGKLLLRPWRSSQRRRR